MNPSRTQEQSLSRVFHRARLQRGLAFGVIIVTALLAFETFNYSTTDYALTDLLGDLSFMGVRWATILAIAFCGIDFAGIARLFTPEDGADQPGEVWYLFGAWLLAATMNAMLTWWGVSLAILNHETLGSAVIERGMLVRVVPIFVSVLVWLIRVLIIGTFSVAGDRLFSMGDVRVVARPQRLGISRPAASSLPARAIDAVREQIERRPSPAPRAVAPPRSNFKPAPKPEPEPEPAGYARPEPTYHPVAASSSRPRPPINDRNRPSRYRTLNGNGRARN